MEKQTELDQHFLELLITGGIAALAADLAAEIGQPLVFIDAAGMALWRHGLAPDMVLLQAQLHNMPKLSSLEYYYHRENKWLFYEFTEKAEVLRVCFCQTEMAEISKKIHLFCLRRLALQTYLDMQMQAKRQAERLEKNLAEALVQSSANIHDIIGFHKMHLKADRYYGILLLEPVNDGEQISLLDIERCRLKAGCFSPVLWHQTLVLILPAETPILGNEIKLLAESYKGQLEAELNLKLVGGIGRFYQLAKLHHSYIEAKIALAFSEDPSPVSLQLFDDMGIFSVIFSREIGELKAYVAETIGPIITYDRDMKLQLIDTLRILLKNGFNWAKTAKEMFAHVNTIHYRYEKIEKMLGLDLAGGKGQSDMFAAMKVWDVLNRASLITEEACVGKRK